MKKIYLSLVCLTAISASTIAQTSRVVSEKSQKHFTGTEVVSQKAKPQTNLMKADPVWSDDFSTPANWVMTNTSNPDIDWTIETNPGAIPNAAASLYPFASATASNGYALINSDGIPGNTDNDGTPTIAEITTATPIDLSAYSNVVLTFSHNYRWYLDTRGFRVSPDNGATWVEYEITNFDGYPNLQNSANPENEVYNISDVAGGQSQVLIQFYYNDNDIWAWYWAVDDVAIYEQPDNDIQILSAYAAGTNNEGTEYGRTMINHLDDSYLFGAQVYNFGVNDQTGIEVDVDYTSFGTNLVFGTILSGDTLVVESEETPTLALGVYEGLFTGTSNEEVIVDFLDNNVYARDFAVTTMEYSQDGIGIYPEADLVLSSIGTGSFTDATDGLFIGAWYHVKETDNFSGVKIMLAPGTVADAFVMAHILDTANVLADDMTPMYSSPEYYITATDISNGYAIVNFPSLVSLNPGCYYAAVECFSGGGVNDVYIYDDVTVAQPSVASIIHIAGDATYTNGNAIGVRLMADDSAELNENTLEGVNIYPNPSEGIVTISNDLSVENTITVMDLTGKVVATKVASSATTVDLTAVGTGVYLVEVSNANGKKVERVVIK